MASDKQVLANRRNTAKSTGSKAVNGKLQSRRNATRHALTASCLLCVDAVALFEPTHLDHGPR